MATLDDMLKEFPPGVRRVVEPVYAGLSPDKQKQLTDMLANLPTKNVGSVKRLLELVVEQYRPLAGHKERIAIVGPVNTGKSSLYNQFIRRPDDRAAVSPVPGTTRANQESDAGLFAVVDTPGADACGPVGQVERDRAFSAAQSADLLVLVFDASKGIAAADRQLYDTLAALGKPYLIVLNKIDVIAARDRPAVLAQVAENLGVTPEQVIPTSATEGENVGQVLLAVVKAEPQLLLALGQAVPAYRAQLAWPRVMSAAAAAGTIALVPIPVVTFLPLITLQAGLILNIAGIYGYPLNMSRARELAATFGAGFGARMLFQQLSELLPVAGWVLSAAIASSTTAAMGYAAIQWFDRGEKVSVDAMRTMAEEWTRGVAGGLRALGDKAPDRRDLRNRLQGVLEQVTRNRR